jgi:predicted Zn-dependent protease
MKPFPFLLTAVGAAFALAGAARAQQQQLKLEPCGSLENAYGPYDYRTEMKYLDIVEKHHFTPLVENLIKPMFQYLAADFDYTLRASPNHHRALISMARNSLRLKDTKPQGATWSVDCYFDRAMRFRPDDMVVRMIFADYLVKAGRTKEAVPQLDYVATTASDNPFTHFNLGLIYLEAKEYEKAVARAQEAQRLGFPRTELKDKLVAAGKWKDARTDAPAATAAAPAASTAAN